MCVFNGVCVCYRKIVCEASFEIKVKSKQTNKKQWVRQKAIDLENLKTLIKGRKFAADRCACCLQLERVTFALGDGFGRVLCEECIWSCLKSNNDVTGKGYRSAACVDTKT